MGLLNAAHRQLYDLKMERGWQGASGGKIVVVDTNVSAENDRLPFSIWWNLPVFAAAGVLVFIQPVRETLAKAPEMWGVTGAAIVSALFFTGMHLWSVRRRNEVYSSSTKMT